MGFSDDPMGSLGCKGGAGRKPLEAIARSLGKSIPSIWTQKVWCSRRSQSDVIGPADKGGAQPTRSLLSKVPGAFAQGRVLRSRTCPLSPFAGSVFRVCGLNRDNCASKRYLTTVGDTLGCSKGGEGTVATSKLDLEAAEAASFL